jgi:hypothetical protein
VNLHLQLQGPSSLQLRTRSHSVSVILAAVRTQLTLVVTTAQCARNAILMRLVRKLRGSHALALRGPLISCRLAPDRTLLQVIININAARARLRLIAACAIAVTLCTLALRPTRVANGTFRFCRVHVQDANPLNQDAS